MFLRLIILVGLVYLLLRLLKSMVKDKQPQVHRGGAEKKPDLFPSEDIEDVPFTELPPGEKSDDSTSSPKKN